MTFLLCVFSLSSSLFTSLSVLLCPCVFFLLSFFSYAGFQISVLTGWAFSSWSTAADHVTRSCSNRNGERSVWPELFSPCRRFLRITEQKICVSVYSKSRNVDWDSSKLDWQVVPGKLLANWICKVSQKPQEGCNYICLCVCFVYLFSFWYLFFFLLKRQTFQNSTFTYVSEALCVHTCHLEVNCWFPVIQSVLMKGKCRLLVWETRTICYKGG